MKPEETGSYYDRIALSWQKQLVRFTQAFLKHGFTPTSVDISAEMISLARQWHPGVTFYTEDICIWQFPHKYDLISAWDSTFHLSLAEQKPVLKKMCDGLNPQGILLFTCGGSIGHEEISAGFEDETFDYSPLGVNEFLRLLIDFGCTCKHLEYDPYPENHVYIIAQKLP